MGTMWGRGKIRPGCENGLGWEAVRPLPDWTLASVPKSIEMRDGSEAARQRRAGFLGSCMNHTCQCSLLDSYKPKMWHFSKVI